MRKQAALQQLGQTCPGLVRLGWLGHAGPGAQTRPKPLMLRSTDAAQEWILYAMQKTAKSFVLKLQLLPIWNWYGLETNRCNIWQVQPMMDLFNLPSLAKLETMHCKLEGVKAPAPRHCSVLLARGSLT